MSSVVAGKTGPARRGRVVAVLTSARSGSSVTAHALQVLGVDLGDRLRPAMPKNPKGFFEDLDILDLSRRLRQALVDGRRLALVPPERWDDPVVHALEEEAVELIQRRFAAKPLWGFKDGRTLRFLPFWERVLERAGVDVDYVIALRHPMASAASRRRSRLAKALDNDIGVEVNQFQWLIEVAPHFPRLRDKRFTVVAFERLAGEPTPELARLSSRLDLPGTPETDSPAVDFATEFLAPDLISHRHAADDPDPSDRLHPMVRDAYRWLHALATDEISADEPALWDDWARILRELEALAPLLRAVGDAEVALRQARNNPLVSLPGLLRALSERLRASDRRA